jgi:hypothetical protein
MHENGLCRRSRTNAQSLVSVYRVYPVNIDTMFIRIYLLQYAVQRRRFTIDCLWLIFMGDAFKRQHRGIIRQIVGT